MIASFECGGFGDADHGVLGDCVGDSALEGHDGVDGGAVSYCTALGRAAVLSAQRCQSISVFLVLNCVSENGKRIGVFTLRYSPASSSI